ncbi:gastrotropin [Solea senegalensis]|uniref:Gastrotropin n=2 Tax=Solea senegalensis TaxID=28829 RepID=A0AAV6SP16_SOLSE|nr:gastrotropin [Solea senegalensis]
MWRTEHIKVVVVEFPASAFDGRTSFIMAFTGKYVLETQENYEEFLKAVGIKALEDLNNPNVVTDIYQNDTFRLTKLLEDKTWNNQFLIGREAELKTLDGEKFKTTVTLDGGKLKIHFPNYLYTAEVVGDKLIEVKTVGAVSSTLISKKMK